MRKKTLKIGNKLGLHARAAAIFVKTANKYKSEFRVNKDDIEVDGKSIMGLLSLCAPKGSKIEVVVQGDDEDNALSAIVKLVKEKFGEE